MNDPRTLEELLEQIEEPEPQQENTALSCDKDGHLTDHQYELRQLSGPQARIEAQYYYRVLFHLVEQYTRDERPTPQPELQPSVAFDLSK